MNSSQAAPATTSARGIELSEGFSRTNLSVPGLAWDAVILTVALVFYIFKVGGIARAKSRLFSANWKWLAIDVAVPLGLPSLITLVILGLAWGAEVSGGADYSAAFAELTPWTLCFFSLTILTASLSRLKGKASTWTGLVWLTILVISLFAGFLTLGHGTNATPVGLRPYSFSVLFTLVAIYVSHATTRLPEQ